MKSKRLNKFCEFAGFIIFSPFLLVSCGKEDAVGLDTAEMIEALYKKNMWNEEHKAASPAYKKELQEGIGALEGEIDDLKKTLYEERTFKHFLVYLGVINKYVQCNSEQAALSEVQKMIDEEIAKIKNNSKYGAYYETFLVNSFNGIAMHRDIIISFHSKATKKFDKDVSEEYDEYYKENTNHYYGLKYFSEKHEGKEFNDDSINHGKLFFKELKEARDLYLEIISKAIELGKKKRYLASIPDAK